MRLVYPWLRDLAPVTADVETVARELSLRGFEVASVEPGPQAVIDFEITANRPDCLSHVGLAREACAVWNLTLEAPALARAEEGAAGLFDVRLEDPALCPRYCAQAFEVRVGASPAWLQERLQAAGVRPISNIVDVTNYVMLELGQPMHAFDLARLEGRTLVIRRARAGERLRTLDGLERALEPDMLVIADAGRATAIGGVMGGRESEISGSTTTIVLESAYFHPPSVRRTSKRLALRTEASIRFERGADIEAPPLGLARAAALFEQIGAGRAVSGVVDRYPEPSVPRTIELRSARLTRILGHAVPDADVPRYLTPLGFHVSGGASGTWRVVVPTWRVDVSREIDLIEEVGRHHGFDRLPATFPALAGPQPAPDERIRRERRARQVLGACGFSEAMTFAFIEREAALPFCDDGYEPPAIANPLSEKFAVLRPSLLPGLVDACVHNRRRERKDVRLFETGAVFGRAGEGRAAAFVWAGAAAPPHWSAATRPVDFFDAKGIVEQLCAAFGVEIDLVAAARPWMIDGRSAEVRAQGGACLGVVGQIAPTVLDVRGMPPGEAVVGAEIDLVAIGAHAARDDLQAQPLPRYPSIVRDVSILVDEALPAAAVRGTIRSAAPDTLSAIAEFDRYQGKGVPEGRVSLSLRLTFRAPDRTLTDEEAQAATERIVEALRAAHGAERR